MRYGRIGWGDLAESIRGCSKGEVPRGFVCAASPIITTGFLASPDPNVSPFEEIQSNWEETC